MYETRFTCCRVVQQFQRDCVDVMCVAHACVVKLLLLYMNSINLAKQQGIICVPVVCYTHGAACCLGRCLLLSMGNTAGCSSSQHTASGFSIIFKLVSAYLSQ